MREGFFFALRHQMYCGLMVAMIFVFSIFLFPRTGLAAVAPTITYQARLADTDGNPLADGTYSMVFSIYNTNTSGIAPIWTANGSTGSPAPISVGVTSSLLTVQLGDTDAGQNGLTNLNWDQQTLYLGITIGSDGEMTPRRRITAVPQALQADNAGRLQGMYASSTASNGNSLFTIHQTQNTGATATRTALEVRSAGTSSAFDYLFRGVNDLGNTVFSLNRAGAVTTTGSLVTGNITASAISGSSLSVTSAETTALSVHGAATLTGAITSAIAESMQTVSVGDLNLPGDATATRMEVVGNMLFVQATSSVYVVDITDPSAETIIATASVGSPVGGFAVQRGRLYVVYDIGASRELYVYKYLNAQGDLAPITTLTLADLSQVTRGVDILVGSQAAYIVGNDDQKVITVDIRSATSMTIRKSITLTDRPVRSRFFGDTIISVVDTVGGGQVHRTSLTEPMDPNYLGSWFSISDGAADFFLNGDIGYIPHSSENTISVINVATGVVINTVSSINGASQIFENGGRMFVYGTDSGGSYSVYNTTSSTAPSFIARETIGYSGLSFAQKGEILIIGINSAPSVIFVRLPSISVNAFRGGTGTFFSLNTSGDLRVMGSVDIGQRLSVGTGGINVGGASQIDASIASGSVLSVINRAAVADHKNWGIFTNRLLVGDEANATGTMSYVSLFAYNTSSRFGVCLDNTNTASTCIDFASTSTAYSLLADDAIGANAFDLAERYAISGDAEPGDILVIDADTPMHMKKSPGVPYDQLLSGVVSTRPGFLLGTGGSASVALVGRVPVKVTVANGAIEPGDALTSSETQGIAMKATRAGRIIGRALQGTTSDGLIEVYLQPGFDASSLLRADGGITSVAEDLGIRSTGVASLDAPTFNSQVVSFFGSAWNGAAPVTTEFRLFNQVASASSSAFTIAHGSSTLLVLNQQGQLEVMGDVTIAGRLYPSARGRAQQDSYIFLDDATEGSRYISTNADGWQSQDGYDYAERYVSPDVLEAGDVVTVRRGSRLYVQRALDATDMVVGIVSTKPGFIAGRVQEDAYPIALAGRVPTKISTINGAIEAGDVLAPSTIPGVAVKATQAGPMIGIALEAYSGSDVGKIETFVNPGWWGGAPSSAKDAESAVAGGRVHSGFAQIVVGQSRVRVQLQDFIRYPHIQVTPYTQVESGWWIDRVSPEGFEIILGAPIGRAARFSWTAEEVHEAPTVTLSSGSRFSMDPVSGEIQFPPSQDETTVQKPQINAEIISGTEEQPAPPIETLPEVDSPETPTTTPATPGPSTPQVEPIIEPATSTQTSVAEGEEVP